MAYPINLARDNPAKPRPPACEAKEGGCAYVVAVDPSPTGMPRKMLLVPKLLHWVVALTHKVGISLIKTLLL